MSIGALIFLLILIYILMRIPVDPEIRNIGFIVVFIAVVVLVLRLCGVWL